MIDYSPDCILDNNCSANGKEHSGHHREEIDDAHVGEAVCDEDCRQSDRSEDDHLMVLFAADQVAEQMRLKVQYD